LSAKEQDWGATNVLTTTNTTTHCTAELSGRQFTYDNVWDTKTSQTELYREISDHLLQSFLDGFNATVRLSLSLFFFYKQELGIDWKAISHYASSHLSFCSFVVGRSWPMDKLDLERHLRWEVKHTRNSN
jgi:hypothetical protein